tara:strand:- start:2125 stop:2646 length:522 start_codon:yes stop_codon:yes gene_type:complete
MIIGHETGDITHPSNKRDIIIGMNRTLQNVTGIGYPFVSGLNLAGELELGGVLSFKFDHGRHLHMLICHTNEIGGWEDSHKYVRFGLDFLWQQDTDGRDFSIVEIGTGKNGRKQGADAPRIHRAMGNSFLDLTLFVNHNDPERVAAHDALVVPMEAYRAWTPQGGIVELAAAA